MRGLGTRLREYSDAIPKPMVPIGLRPIIWHLMRYYAHFGHTEFVLCLGYKSQVIKEYFLDYREWVSNDFVLSDGGRDIQLLSRDIDDWKITFAETGIGLEHRRAAQGRGALPRQRGGLPGQLLRRAHRPRSGQIRRHLSRPTRQGCQLLAVQSTQSFHVADVADNGEVASIDPLSESDLWINGGFFVFRNEIFRHLHQGEDSVRAVQRLIAERKLWAHRYRGFWTAMDTFKDRQALEERYEKGDAPWEVWKQPSLEKVSSRC